MSASFDKLRTSGKVKPCNALPIKKRVRVRSPSGPTSLRFLQFVDPLPRAPVDLRHVPAIESGVRIDLRPVVYLVLDEHHKDAPSAQRASVSIILMRRHSHSGGVSSSRR